ncbi:MAG: 30S ribosomal protein S8 [Patescibacteria group bacterium]|jgi:small subunit ribosomal protein S8
MTDPIADMITRIRNGFLVKKVEVVVPFSHLKKSLADLLVAEGYLEGVETIDVAAIPWSPRTSIRAGRKGRSNLLRLVLHYAADGKPAAKSLIRISKPSNRVYVKKDAVPIVHSGLGIAIISTPQGLMTNRQARRAGVGGELLCRIY